MGKLEGQVVIVTGASAGIGEATARRLAREGARVVLAARRKEKLDALRQEVEAGGGKATAVVADVTSAGDRERLVREAVAAHGRIDALINNAGYGHRGPIELVPIESIRQNFETNLFSLIALTQLVIPIMRNQGAGRIVNVSSVAGKIARPLSSVYDSTKHALEAVSDGLRGELAMFGIKVVIIEPGFIVTEFSQVSNRVSRPVVEEAGPYDESLKSFGRGSERMRKMAGRPEDIAELIERALVAKNPRARYAGPRHARFALGLKRLLPERVFEYFLSRQTGLAGASEKGRAR
ncbi:MAG TPA: SDR family NAD(P)-dependent oxidoreductase [Blastocatellia bacterium]|jgi:short-subunit dehydrogenase|nr:SDR family NAD(P)-dependent oxidoreductase [Blastocatellia bacterium]